MTGPSIDQTSTECCSTFVRRWWWTAFLTIPALTLIGLLAGAIVAYKTPPLFEAYATFKRDASEAAAGDWSQLSNREWLQSVADKGSVSADDLANRLVTRSDVEGRFQLGFKSADANEAAMVANALAKHWSTDKAPNTENQYLGRVVLQINHEQTDWDIFDNGRAAGRGALPSDFVETEQKLISSKKTLYEVVQNLSLDERWEMTLPQAYERLISHLNVRRDGNTPLIVLEYVDQDPQLARDVANGVAKAYRDRRMSIEFNRSRAALHTLQRQLKDQEDRVEEARLRMLDLAERYRIIDLAAMNASPSASGDPITGQGTILMSSMQDTYQAEAAIAEITMQIRTLASLADEELINAAASLEIKDVSFDALYADYQELKRERSTLGEEHPRTEEIEKQIKQASTMLAAAADSVRRTLQTKLQMAEQAMVLAKDIEESKKDNSMDERRKVAEYSESSKEYELQKNMLANMQGKYAMETVDLTMPKTPITIHEDAEEAAAPITRLTTGNDFKVVSWAIPTSRALPVTWPPYLLGGSGVGLLLSLLLAVPIMRMHQAVFG